jgi:hypothetical protein
MLSHSAAWFFSSATCGAKRGYRFAIKNHSQFPGTSAGSDPLTGP